MRTVYCFDDVLIVPGWSEIKSRKDVTLETEFMGTKIRVPIISAPMDSLTNARLAVELHKFGGLACLHRFQTIQSNINEFSDVTIQSNVKPIASVGLNDIERVQALYDLGMDKCLIDVAHGGQAQVAKYTSDLFNKYPDLQIMVGNFATFDQLYHFVEYSDTLRNAHSKGTLWFRIGVGSGSACKTRVVTGCGLPTMHSIIDASLGKHYAPIVADGGIKNSGDVAKALAAGARVVMLGSMLAGTNESPGEGPIAGYKNYRGSASSSSYRDQGKEWAAEEGEEFSIPCKGPVQGVLTQIEAGLRSAMTYVGSSNLTEFRKNAKIVSITGNGLIENYPHGKNLKG